MKKTIVALCAAIMLVPVFNLNAAAKDCCKPKAECCKPAAPCCKEDEKKKSEAATVSNKTEDCCKPAAACCKKDEKCCDKKVAAAPKKSENKN